MASWSTGRNGGGGDWQGQGESWADWGSDPSAKWQPSGDRGQQSGDRDWSSAGSGRHDGGARVEKDPLPFGWETARSRSTGETYYINTFTNETQYEWPDGPAPQTEENPTWSGRDAYDDGSYGGGGGQRLDMGSGSGLGGGSGGVGGGSIRADPKASFLDFDAKGSNLSSSRELYLQKKQEEGDGDNKDKKKKSRSRRRSRSKKRKRKKSSSSSSSSSSSGRKKGKSKKETEEERKKNEERIKRIKDARQAKKGGVPEMVAPPKWTDGGTLD